MTLNELEIEFQKAYYINFDGNGSHFILYFKEKETALVTYAMIGEYFDDQPIIASAIVEEKIKLTLVSKTTGDAINSSMLEYDESRLAEFKEKIYPQSKVDIFVGYKHHDTPIMIPLLVEMQNFRLSVNGYIF